MSAATYTYAVARPFDPERLAGVTGVDGAAVRLVRHEDLVAVVSDLSAGEALPARLEDVTELEALARAHHAVVDAVAGLSVVVPCRLATSIHSHEQRVVYMLRDRRGQLGMALDRIAGRVEVGVKATHLHPTTTDEPDPETAATTTSPGRDYLRRRRQDAARRDAGLRQSLADARHVDETMATLAVDRCHHRLQDPQNVLNAAYLVEASTVEAFVARAHEVAAAVSAVSVVVTGPWPPYSFTVPDGEEPA